MPNLTKSILLVATTLFTAITANSVQAETICSDQPELLAKREGVYVSKKLVETVRKTRRWDLGQPDESGISELRISPSGVVKLSFAWHEAASLGVEFQRGCLTFDGNQVRLRQNQHNWSVVFERLGSATNLKQEDALYADLLFKGCFVDQDRLRWCFGSKTVDIAGAVRQTTLRLDQSELPTGGAVVEVAGERDFWLFVPRGTGWSVYQTTWASAENYVEPVWSRPWKVLTRVK